jgi:hypothetical protein
VAFGVAKGVVVVAVERQGLPGGPERAELRGAGQDGLQDELCRPAAGAAGWP